MRYEILDEEGNVVNTIVADQQFVDANHPNSYREVSEPVIDIPPAEPVKTDEEKLADAISAAVAKLVADGVLKPA